MESVLNLRNIGSGKNAIIFATGHSYLDIDCSSIDDSIIRIEINKMRMPCNINYSIYYDREWMHYFDDFEKLDRELIGFKVHLSKHVNYVYDTEIIPFSDTGFHALYLASEIMNFRNIYLVGYDYYKVNDKWHPYEDDFITEQSNKKKLEILQDQIDKYNDIKWTNAIFNCNKESALKVFPYGLPYKN